MCPELGYAALSHRTLTALSWVVDCGDEARGGQQTHGTPDLSERSVQNCLLNMVPPATTDCPVCGSEQ